MHRLSPADELAEVRAAIARLRQREMRLALAVEIGEPTPIIPRPGWPIARQCVAARH